MSCFQSRNKGDRGTLPSRPPNRHRLRETVTLSDGLVVRRVPDVPKGKPKTDPRTPEQWLSILGGQEKITNFIRRCF